MNTLQVINEINNLVDLVEGRQTKAFRGIAKKIKVIVKSWRIEEIYEL